MHFLLDLRWPLEQQSNPWADYRRASRRTLGSNCRVQGVYSTRRRGGAQRAQSLEEHHSMKHSSVWLCTVTLAALFAAAPGFSAQEGKDRAALPGAKSEDRITREVRHELVMVPYYGVFDNLAYRVDGGTVTLLGQVTRPTLKSDAGNVETSRGSRQSRQSNPGAAAFAD